MGLDKLTEKMMAAQIPQRYRSRSVTLAQLGEIKNRDEVKEWVKHLPTHLKGGQGLLVRGTRDQCHLVAGFTARMGCLNRILSYYITINAVQEAELDPWRSWYKSDYPMHEWLISVPLLCIVDLGEEFMNDRWRSRLYFLLSQRNDFGKVTVVTTKLNNKSLLQHCGASIVQLFKETFTAIGL